MVELFMRRNYTINTSEVSRLYILKGSDTGFFSVALFFCSCQCIIHAGSRCKRNPGKTIKDAIKSGNDDGALNFCSEDTLKMTSGQTWKTFFEVATAKLGAIKDYNIVRDSCFYYIDAKGQAGHGNY